MKPKRKHLNMHKHYSTRRAFTLVEISIVLIIIGLIVAGGANMVKSLSLRAKKVETTTALQEAQATIEGFVYTYKRLPTKKEFEHIVIDQKDAWHKAIYYAFDPALTIADNLCQTKRTSLSATIEGSDRNAIAYMLLSSGKNRNQQAGVVNNHIVIAQAYSDFDGIAEDIERVEAFDDQFKLFSIFALKRVAQCQ